MDNIDNYDKATNLLFEYEKLYFTSPDEALKKMVDLYDLIKKLIFMILGIELNYG